MKDEEIVARAIVDAGYNPATAQGIAYFALAALSSAGRLVEWEPVSTAPTGDEIFLAYTADGRQMIVRGSILQSMMKITTPNHLQFPATHWMPLPLGPLASAPHPAPDETESPNA